MAANVAGLNHMNKRHRTGKFIKNENLGIVCLQETHLRCKEENIFHHFNGILCHAPAEYKTKGVLIHIVQSVPWTLTSI